MAKVFNINETKVVTLTCDNDLQEEEKSKFTIARIGSRLESHILDKTTKYNINDIAGEKKVNADIDFNSSSDMYMQFGLIAWENFGIQIEFTDVVVSGVGTFKGLSQKCMDALKPYRIELGGLIRDFSNLNEDEKKNF